MAALVVRASASPPSSPVLVDAAVKLLLGKDNGAVRSTHPFPEKEFCHDQATPTHDRGHGDPQSFSQYAALVPAAGLRLCQILSSLARGRRPGRDSRLPSASDQRAQTRSGDPLHRRRGAALFVQGDPQARMGRRGNPAAEETVQPAGDLKPRGSPPLPGVDCQLQTPRHSDDGLRGRTADLRGHAAEDHRY